VNNKKIEKEVSELNNRVADLEKNTNKSNFIFSRFKIFLNPHQYFTVFKKHFILITFIFLLSMSALVIIEIAKRYSGIHFSTEISLLISIFFAGIISSIVALAAAKKIDAYRDISTVLFREKKNLELELINTRLQFENKVQERTSELAEINDLLNDEIEARKKSEEALKRSERKYRLLYRHSPVGIFHYDKDLVVNDFNERFTSILKARREELMKFNFNNVNDNKFISALKAGLKGLEGKYEGALQITEHNYTVSLVTAPFYNQFRDIQGGVGIIEDINERKQSENLLILAKEKAEESDKMKSEFVAQLSHEIRTPIHIIQSFSDLLKQELSPEIKEDLRTAVNIISDAGGRISRTLGQIINIAELQSGDYKYSPKLIDLYKDILLGIVSNYRTAAIEKSLQLTLSKSTEMTLLKGDEYSIHQIFSNLVDNAIKFTSSGKIYIDIFRAQSNQISVEISDSGIGISEEYLPQLFTPFSQENVGYSRLYEGNGLGMALVKKYCELNEALISVRSKRNVGTTFIVTFSN
jgi:PAS domain S-box-containing protein